jgi:hypothetical protein
MIRRQTSHQQKASHDEALRSDSGFAAWSKLGVTVRLGRLMGVHGAGLLLDEGCGGYET